MAAEAVSSRAHYMAAVFEALRAQGGVSGPQKVYDWLKANGKARPDDLTTELKSGGVRFEKEVRFARMMLARAGLLVIVEHGVWHLSEAALSVDLTPERAARVLSDLNGATVGGLSMERVYGAIVKAAREDRFVSYGQLAAACGVEWSKAYRPLPILLGRLVTLARLRGWPMLSAVVVPKDRLDTGVLEGGALDGFLTAARDIGVDPGEDLQAFVREQQNKVFAWAKTAPDRMGVEGGAVGADPEPGDEDEARPITGVAEPAAPFVGPPAAERPIRYWFGGAAWENVDQTDRFRAEGVWQNGYDDQFSELVRQMGPGDRIAIKAAFVRKRNLPFDVGGASVSVMRIKATGTVIANLGDGRTVRVAWDPPAPARDWFFYTYRTTLCEADPDVEPARALIDFAFAGTVQDYDWWLARPYFAEKYARKPLAATAGAGEADDAEVEDALPAVRYETADIVREGCFLGKDRLDEILVRLTSKMNLVLQGPPGTGKTWLAKRLGYALLGTDGPETVKLRMRVVQFHPSLAYEDFVRGWRPVDGKLELSDGVFMQAIEAARSEPERPFVLVIEEINRGNPAQIFGEMLTLLEGSKRRKEEGIELAYPRFSGERVFIPDNLFVIGTMNVADRSLALVDLALRRRFAFVSLAPQLGDEWRKWCRDVGGLDAGLLGEIETRMTALNETIARDRSLGEQFRVGHSYVTPTGFVGDGRAWFASVIETEIVPLLDEYWHDQRSKVVEARAALLLGKS